MPFSSIKFPDYGWKDPAILCYNIGVFFCHRYIIYAKGAAVNFDTGNTQRIKETLILYLSPIPPNPMILWFSLK